MTKPEIIRQGSIVSKLLFVATMVLFGLGMTGDFYYVFLHLGDLLTGNYLVGIGRMRAFTVVGINIILTCFGLLYYWKAMPSSLQKSIDRVRQFEISDRIGFLSLIVMVTVFIVFTINDIFINEETQYGDYFIIKNALKVWPNQTFTHSPSIQFNDIVISDHLHRHVKMILLYISANFLHNVKIMPYATTILIIVLTYFLTKKLSQRNVAGLIAVAVLLQSSTFHRYDAAAVYENSWILLYMVSLYSLFNKWYLSPLSYGLSIFSKGLTAPYILMSIFVSYWLNIPKNRKTKLTILYCIALMVATVIFVFQRIAGGGGFIDINFFRLYFGLSEYMDHLISETPLLYTVIPVILALYLSAKNGKRVADCLLCLMLGILVIEPLSSVFIPSIVGSPMDYRSIILIVFYAISLGTVFSKNPELRPLVK